MAANSEQLGTAELLFRCAHEMGLRPTWISPNALFAVTVGGKERYVNCAQSSTNSHLSSGLVKNKFMTRLILHRQGMLNIPFARAYSHAEAEEFLLLHDKIIAKPIHGSGSKDIHIITTASQLRELDITKYILEKYIAGTEMRYLVLNDAVIAVHESEYGTSVDEHRPLQRFSYSEIEWDPVLIESSKQIARIFGLKFTAIDYMIDETGKAYILEANSTPGLKWFHAPTSGPAVDVARLFLEDMIENTPTTTKQPGGFDTIRPKTPVRDYLSPPRNAVHRTFNL